MAGLEAWPLDPSYPEFPEKPPPEFKSVSIVKSAVAPVALSRAVLFAISLPLIKLKAPLPTPVDVLTRDLKRFITP